MSESKTLVLRFYPSEKVFHAVNAFSWLFLIVTGVAAKYRLVEADTAAQWMQWHIVVAVIFSLNLIGFVLLAPDRMLVMLQSLLIWDKSSFAWFKNFGGYPRKLFGIDFGPEHEPPQGRYNGGQKPVYLYLIGVQVVLLVTGWSIYLLVPSLAKWGVWLMYNLHVWGAISATLLLLLIHIPLAFLNWEFFKAMWRIGPGTLPLEVAEQQMVKWVAEDLTSVQEKT